MSANNESGGHVHAAQLHERLGEVPNGKDKKNFRKGAEGT